MSNVVGVVFKENGKVYFFNGLNLNIKDDLACLANQTNEDFLYYENMKKDKFSSIEMEVIKNKNL